MFLGITCEKLMSHIVETLKKKFLETKVCQMIKSNVYGLFLSSIIFLNFSYLFAHVAFVSLNLSNFMYFNYFPPYSLFDL